MKFIAMDLIHGFRFKHHYKVENLYKGGVGLTSNAHFLVIKLPNSWVLKLVARTLVLALIIASFPQISSVIGGISSSTSEAEIAFDPITNFDLLPLLFRDLKNEGILKTGDRALFFGHKNDEGYYYNSEKDEMMMDFVSFTDRDKQSAVTDDTFDFAFTQGFHAAAAREFIERTLKVGGVAAVQLSEDPLMAFKKPDNYQIVYLRRFDTTIIGMRKTSSAVVVKSPAKRKLFGVTTEAKKAALKKLEDVLLEPPRAASGKSKTYLKRTRYLPDLLGDSLESYPRRVFIDVGLPEKDSAIVGWFEKHYPTRNKDFELYKIETVTEEFSGKEVQPQIGISDWLRKNVKEEEYVVMKAEAEVVEEMVKSRVLGLVDELFLECKYKGLSGKSKKSRRAYWECLALYGRLRDEGVAVHQWWG